MTAHEFLFCTIHEKRFVKYNNELLKVFYFKDIIGCVYNPFLDEYTHLSGKYLGKKTPDEFVDGKTTNFLTKIDNKYIADECIKTNKTINDLIESFKSKLKENPFNSIDKYGNIYEITDKKLVDKLNKIFNINKQGLIYKLLDYSDINNALTTLEININTLKKIEDKESRYSSIDDELDRFNSYFKKKK